MPVCISALYLTVKTKYFLEEVLIKDLFTKELLMKDKVL